jgi:hypothetical protein
MSTINTSGIDANYPIPGQNNNTQGFRDNFAAIKTNLNTAGTEITDLQSKVVLKSALANSTLNNNMGNTLIANASILQFRNTTYNLGNALVDNVLVDCSLGDVQYGNLAGNITLSFGSWIPSGTLGGVELQIGRPDANSAYTITFPTQAVFSNDYGWSILENSNTANSLTTLTFPYNSTQLNLKLTSTDCGNTIYVQPLNRSFKSTEIQTRTPPSTGQLGDTVGTVCVDPGVAQLVITGANTDPYFTTSNTSTLTSGLPVVITGQSLTGNVVIGNTYYIRNVVSSTTFTLSSTLGGANIAIGSNVIGNTMLLNPVQYMYLAVQDYDASTYAKTITRTTSPNVITVSSSMANIANNIPVMFSGNANGNTGISTNTVYYVKSVSGSNITLSLSRYNGIAGTEFQGINTVANPNIDVTFTVYDGSDIFRRIPLQPF